MNIVNVLLWVVYLLSLYLGVFWLITILEHRRDFSKETPRRIALKRYPLVSVLIPVYNGEKIVSDTISSVLNLNYPREKLEIIVINDGSEDNTKQVVEKVIRDNPQRKMKLLNQNNQGKAAALNNALKIAKGEFFACLDADSYVTRNTLRKMLSVYEKHDKRLAVVTPVMHVRNPKTIIQWLQKIEYVVSLFVVRLMSHLDCIYVAPGPFSLYRTEVIRKLGGFDGSTFTEDQEIGYRVQKHHLRLKQCPEATVYTIAPATVVALYCQRRRWLRGSLMNILKYKKIIFNKEYGDFGMFQVPLNLLTYFFSIAAITLFTYFLILPVARQIRNLFLIRFDFFPYLKSMFTFNFNLINYSLNRILVFLLVLLFTIVLIYIAYRHSQDTLTKSKKLYIVPYLFLYYLLISFIAAKVLFDFIIGRKQKW